MQPRHPATPTTEQNFNKLQHWMDALDPREQAQVRHAIEYAERYIGAGAPGHGQFVLIAKLARQLNEREQAITFAKGKPVIQKIVWSESDQCWRDIITGVKVEP
jgi:hypothetical protein